MKLFDVIAMAPPAGGAGEQPPAIFQFLPIIFIFVIFYFLMIRPSQQKQKKLQQMQQDLKKNDKIITSGGIHGIVVGTRDHVVTIKISDNVKIDVSRASISNVKTGSEEN